MKTALLCGLNYPGTSSELKGCCNDVISMKNLLLKEGWEEKNIRTLTDDYDSCFQPTKSNIIDGLSWLVRMSHKFPGEQQFLHYSGHGLNIANNSNMKGQGTVSDEKDGMDEALLTTDEKYLFDDQIHSVLIKPLNVNSKLTVVFDMCHSGSGLDLKWSTDGRYLYDEAKNRQGRNADVHFYSGCRDDQTSADAWDSINKKGEGAMTNAFVKAYEFAGVGKIGAIDFLNHMYSVLDEGSFVQRPRFSSSKKISLKTELHLEKTSCSVFSHRGKSNIPDQQIVYGSDFIYNGGGVYRNERGNSFTIV
jgi:hypothetical protein